MKYCAENDLSLFAFHDAELTLVSFDGKDLAVDAEYLNIHKNTLQNPREYDMEIATGQILFQGFHPICYKPGSRWESDEKGNAHSVESQVAFYQQEAMERILAELKKTMVVFHLKKEDSGKYTASGCGVEPYFELEFTCDSVRVTWEEYRKKAWYELQRHYRYPFTVQTPEGDETLQVIVNTCEAEPDETTGLEQPFCVNVGLEYRGKWYWGHGNDCLWIDAFASLQNRLPEGIILKGCLTCRHGNLCPVGNDANEVFCTKDVCITRKSDLYFYTEDAGEREKRLRAYCDLCEGHRHQTEDYYTYSDYLEQLKMR